jgi:predicted enzyme related to lactoylglutathione lyase
MIVSETFLTLAVADMTRATAFYKNALGATVSFASRAWSSLHVANVRIGLYPGEPSASGLHFVVDDLASALAAVERAGGAIAQAASEVAPGVVIALVRDTEGNTFALRAP